MFKQPKLELPDPPPPPPAPPTKADPTVISAGMRQEGRRKGRESLITTSPTGLNRRGTGRRTLIGGDRG